MSGILQQNLQIMLFLKLKFMSDNGQTIWQSGEMKQGMLKEIDIEVEDMNYIIIKVFRFRKGRYESFSI